MKKNQELEIVNRRIEELFQQWKSLQPLKNENQERFDKKVRLDWNFHSNKIEGNTLTYGETELLLREGKEAGIHPPRDYEEMKAHDIAINKVKELVEDKDHNLTEADIRDLNKIILKEPFWSKAQTLDGTSKKRIIPVQYKTKPNYVQTETGETFKFAEPHEVPLKMQELMNWFCEEMENPSLFIASFLAELHHKFIMIHPFDDGNGRVIRLLMNYVLLRFGYPPIAIKAEDKKNYFAALQRSNDGDVDALAIYLGKVLISWLEIGIKAGKGENISHTDDVYKEVNSFIMEQVSKGLDQYFSKKSAIYLIDHLSDILFEPFENNFKRYNEMFSSTSREQTIDSPAKRVYIPSKKL